MTLKMTLLKEAKRKVDFSKKIEICFSDKIEYLESSLDMIHDIENLWEMSGCKLPNVYKDDMSQARATLRQGMVDIYKEWLEELRAKANKERDDIVGYMTEGWGDDAMTIRLACSGVNTNLDNLQSINREMVICEHRLNCLKKYKGVQV